MNPSVSLLLLILVCILIPIIVVTRSHHNYLKSCQRLQSPIKLDEKFYYLIDESEYNRLKHMERELEGVAQLLGTPSSTDEIPPK